MTGSGVVVGFGGASRNAAVALCADGRLLAACERERLTRVRAIGVDHGRAPETEQAVLRIAGYEPGQIDAYACAEPGIAAPASNACVQLDHHFAHAATAFLTSPFERAAILICDRHGDPEVSLWRGEGPSIKPLSPRWSGPGLARLYSACAVAFGLEGEEQRLEALARGGVAEPIAALERFAFAGDYIAYADRLQRVVAERYAAASSSGFFAVAALAASVQAHLGDLLIELVTSIHAATGLDQLCVGGGLFYNTYFNTRIARSGIFGRVQVPVNPGNAGLSAGAALAVGLDRTRTRLDRPTSPFLGPGYDKEDIKKTLDNCKLSYRYLVEPELIAAVAGTLARGGLVGWFQDRMEWGHRALGHRSILASPAAPHVLENLNGYLRKRDIHHPYAFSVCEDDRARLFDGPPAAELMEYDYEVRDESTLRHALPPGHRTVRLHTVGSEPALFRTLLSCMREEHGVPALVNTSFNGFQEPIVCSPRDAIRVFYGSGLDVLAIGRFLIRK